ncbi:uncharacterized [Tachysurus ichikawai]
MASKMKAALEQRSAVMDGKTCGRRKSRKMCAENEVLEEEDRMGTGRRERGGGQDQQHPLQRSFYIKASRRSECTIAFFPQLKTHRY